MAAHHAGGGAPASGCPEGLLLRGQTVSPDDKKFAGLLDCLGVCWQAIEPNELVSGDWKRSSRGRRFCVLTSVRCLAPLLAQFSNSGALPVWMTEAESIYVYGFREEGESQDLLRFLTGDRNANVRRLGAPRVSVSVSTDFPEICGAMSGLRFPAKVSEGQTTFALNARGGSSQSIVSSNEGELFLSVQSRGARFYLNSSAEILDVTSPCTKYFDVREKFGETVPSVMYVKWALGNGAPLAEVGAALIVDDPPLKPRYGFMKYREIVRLMDAHNFATTIAFIPWNWDRTDAQTVRLFHERPDKLSLCVHGCDHTAWEFADRSTAVLNKRVKVSNERMRLLGQRTDLRHDRVMLFPQGAFSAGAARALKLNGFVAAANTEVVPVHKDEYKTKVSDLLGVAIMKYASFPMFTRRYLAHGLENFAFDGLLGKPCLIAAHHDDFIGDARILLNVIEKLNSLHWRLRWRSLGETIHRIFRMRTHGDGQECVEMYGTNLIYRNAQASPNGTTFIKEESDFDCVEKVMVNGHRVDPLHQGGYLKFQVKVPPNESAELRIVYSGDAGLPLTQDDMKYRAKAVLRRYLSEFRDNYLSQNEMLQQSAVRIKEALRL